MPLSVATTERMTCRWRSGCAPRVDGQALSIQEVFEVLRDKHGVGLGSWMDAERGELFLQFHVIGQCPILDDGDITVPAQVGLAFSSVGPWVAQRVCVRRPSVGDQFRRPPFFQAPQASRHAEAFDGIRRSGALRRSLRSRSRGG